MLEKVIGKKIELLPKEPTEGRILCEECGGTGWLLRDNKWLENCPHCSQGLKRTCEHCALPLNSRYSNTCDNLKCVETESIRRREKQHKEELLKYDKAKKVDYDDAPKESVEMMYSERYTYNEGYFSELEDLIENLDKKELPDYVWATHKNRLSIDAGNIIENACDDLHEDARSNINNEKELQDFLNHWCAKQSGVDSYNVNYSMAILLPKDIK